MPSTKLRRIVRWIWIGGGLAFTAWILIGFQAHGVPDDTLTATPTIAVQRNADSFTFLPTKQPRSTGLLFLPGGMVDPIAYAPLLKRVAESGHPTRLITLPWRCGCTDDQIASVFDAVQRVIREDAGRRWILAGHSRGAMLAARYVHERASLPAGLVLIGTTHPRDFSLAALSIPVTKIYGTHDGIADIASSRKNAALLPTATSWIEIEGGNHVQFGFYRHQLGDDSATITRAAQQDAMLKAILDVLYRVELVHGSP